MIDLTADQQAALDQIDEWLGSPEHLQQRRQVFRLFGYAGTGKTTLARHVAEKHPGGVFAAYTGKAALVLGQSLDQKVSTIHGLIYRPDPCRGPDNGADVCEHDWTTAHLEWAEGVDSPLRTARY